MSGLSVSTARRLAGVATDETPEGGTGPRRRESHTATHTPRTASPLQSMLPKFTRAARKLDGGVHFAIASKTADIWGKMSGNRPFARSRRNTSGLQLIRTSNRTLLIAPLSVEKPLSDGTPIDADTSFVVLERVKDNPKNSKAKQTRFHPVRADLSIDTSVSYYRLDNGKWSIHGGPRRDDNASRLSADDAKRLTSLYPGGPVCKIGEREFCGVTLHSGYDVKTHQKNAVMAREQTSNGFRYRLLGGDLKPDADIAPIDGASPDQPFIRDLLDRVVQHYHWPDGEVLALAQHIAVTAFQAGASVSDAAALSETILASARTHLGEAAKPSYEHAAAIAGALCAQGTPLDQVRHAVIDMVRTSERFHAEAAPEIAGADDIGRADALPSAGHTAIRAAQDANLDGFAEAVTAMRLANQNGKGPQMSALHAVAREHFIEKITDVPTLQAVAQRAAADGIAKMRERGAALRQDAQECDKEIGHISNLLRSGSTRRARTERATQLRGRAGAILQRADHIEQTSQPAIHAMVTALLDAHRDAPGEESAALSAATAAWQAIALGGTQATAAAAGSTAHLVRLSGADDDAAQVAGKRMATLCNAGTVVPDSDAAHAHQLTLAQTAIHGGGGWTDAQKRTAMMTAIAALPSMHPVDGLARKRLPQTAALLKTRTPARTDLDVGALAASKSTLFRRVATPAPRKASLSKSETSGIPDHYEVIPTRFDWHNGAPVEGINHAKVRTVSDAGFQSPSGIGATHYMIEMAGPKGRQWVDFTWSANMNQLYGEVSVKPSRNDAAIPAGHTRPVAADDDRVGEEVKVVVAYNGFSAKWESFAKRADDLKARTNAVMHEIDQLITSRDASLSWHNLSYSGAKSGHLDNVVPHFKIRVEEEIRLFAQGRHSQPLFKDNLSKLFIDLAQSIEADRSRKKAITRHQIDSTVRVVAAIAVGAGIGGARLGAAF